MTLTKKLLIIMIALLGFNPIYGEDGELCHVANAGFFAHDGDKSILMDALFARGLVGYHFAPPPLRRELEYGEGRFAKVRMIFASHDHADHMKGEPIIRHLRHNADTAIIMTKQGHNKLRSVDLMPYEEKRIYSDVPKIGEKKILQGMAFPATLYGISHGAGRSIDNIGIRVEVAGKSIMHVGDMDAKLDDLKAAGIDKLKVDWLLLPYWLLLDRASLELVKAAFDAQHIVPMHYDKGDLSDWLKKQGGIDTIKAKVRASLPNIIELDTEMACISLQE